MTSASPGQEPSDGEPAGVIRRIAALYAAHALDIANALGEGPLCVVTGPRRFGKTTSLLPALANILRGRGRTAHIINGRNYEGLSLTMESLPRGRYDVLIIDEANVLTRSKKKTKEELLLLHKKSKAIVSVITYQAGYESSALSLAKTWQDAEWSISGQTTNVVRLPQMCVTPQLARDLLVLYSPLRGEALRAPIVDYIVQTVPLNPHVLLELAGARSTAEVDAIVQREQTTRFQGALSPGEYRKLERALIARASGAARAASHGASRE